MCGCSMREHMQKKQMCENMDRIWRHLHTPFELCPTARGLHQCEWQVFDADRAGCTRCSYVHVCSTDECRLIQTEEAMVCDITGLCLVTKNFVHHQYSDCIAYQGSATTSETSRVQLGEIRKVVGHILASAEAAQCREQILEKFHSRMFSCLQSALISPPIHGVGPVKVINAIEVIEQSLLTVCQRIDLPLNIENICLNQIVDVCAKEICVLMSVSYYKLGMQIRPTDFCDIVVGLLFLMRTGISAHGVCVLPRFALLTSILPVENMLPKIFGMSSKTITDIENKYKMHMRQMSRENLLAVGFNLDHKHFTSHYTVFSCLLQRSATADGEADYAPARSHDPRRQRSR